ncbi:MAG: sel1 repeat family protein [Bacteroidetes bacterium]|nr:sel1 repeat family protein [Bacteroidota bacterium]
MYSPLKYRLLWIALPALLAFASEPLPAQVYPESPVFRDYRPPQDDRDSQGGLRRQIDLFLLERVAARGDPVAQHELGVRYLTGNGVERDTAKSAEWLRRAADQGLPTALYNYALLLNNGWAVEWNPFEAYRLFLRAADAGMPEAQFVVGIFHTDDLVLRQDWDEAYRRLSLSAETGYAPAQRAREEIIRRGYVPLTKDSSRLMKTRELIDLPPKDPSGKQETTPGQEKSAGQENSAGQRDSAGGNASVGRSGEDEWVPVLLDFRQDTTAHFISTTRLLAEYLASVPSSKEDSLAAALLVEGVSSTRGARSAADTRQEISTHAATRRLQRMAQYGNPEAAVLFGRLLEEGRLRAESHESSPRIAAAAQYACAVYLESRRAPKLLLQLLRDESFSTELARAAWDGDATAQYVRAILRVLDIDPRLTETMAHDMLRRAAANRSPKALVQLGILYGSGRWAEQDMAEAEKMWMQAAAIGDREARVRLAAAAVLGQGVTMRISEALSVLEAAMREGSLIAQVAVAFTYERGIGRSPSKGTAVGLYRDAAIRGSQTAYGALRRMHESLRPDVEPFVRSDF